MFLNVSILREYLDVELRVLDLPFEWNLERAVDDWVFLCFFVGNDFLPHLPSLEIREGAIDTLISIWKKFLPTWGYLTDSGDLSLDLVRSLMEQLGEVEDDVFRNRRDAEEGRRKARLRRKTEQKTRDSYSKPSFSHSVMETPKFQSYPVKDHQRPKRLPEDNSEVAKRLKLQLTKKPEAITSFQDLGTVRNEASFVEEVKLFIKIGHC